MLYLFLYTASEELAFELRWHVVNDLHNSDHYPTITSVESSRSSPMQKKRWIIETANWENYQREVENNLQGENLDISTVTRLIQEVALNNIKKTTGKPPRKNIKWMTEELRELIR
jgi:hypothetical protein